MHILCATDLSAEAKGAADVAAALAAKLNIPLRLVYCTEPFIAVGDGMVVPVDDTHVREQLAAETGRIRSTGVDVVFELCHGSPPTEVAASARDPATALLVLGPVTAGLMARFIAGSVAKQTAEKAIVPTLIV
ncbi:MAG: universal stress protein, partial [Prosthecobacter sp.]|nr:universal stress protein [Prosthecobacter sp.]